jgi:hypothetical protein
MYRLLKFQLLLLLSYLIDSLLYLLGHEKEVLFILKHVFEYLDFLTIVLWLDKGDSFELVIIELL